MHAAQLMAAAERVLPNLEEEIAAGRFAGLLGWMREHIHRRGRLLASDALVQEASGSPPSEKWLTDSLRRRYGAAHGFA
jgi:carboxypeptidase Taq